MAGSVGGRDSGESSRVGDSEAVEQTEEHVHGQQAQHRPAPAGEQRRGPPASTAHQRRDEVTVQRGPAEEEDPGKDREQGG
ncbi:MAG TPA: hypothetical protein VFI53_03620, partial [Myxococcaceae bacterium]|nr:hypothetical protein [Myxococcaceae bacterium]